jgi:type II secretory pathway component PulF
VNEAVANERQRRQAAFWKKFALLTRGRLDVLRAMDIIIAEEADAEWRGVLSAVNQSLRSGAALSDALEPHANVFSRSVRELVRSAERTGAWDEILPLIATGLLDATLP